LSFPAFSCIVPSMTTCNQEAVLLITRTVSGTATNVARERTVLTCTLEAGHAGSHHDEAHKETWEHTPSSRQMLFRNDDEAP
jgi:hypothetical protein